MHFVQLNLCDIFYELLKIKSNSPSSLVLLKFWYKCDANVKDVGHSRRYITLLHKLQCFQLVLHGHVLM